MRPGRAGSPIGILLVEDNPADVMLTREALSAVSVPHELHVAADGEQALQFVRKQGVHAGAPRPDLVLLDLNLPRRDGREVLAEIKGDPELRTIPVIVLTTSVAAEDVQRAYHDHANAYLQKPVNFDDFRAIISGLESFWLMAARLPTEPGGS